MAAITHRKSCLLSVSTCWKRGGLDRWSTRSNIPSSTRRASRVVSKVGYVAAVRNNALGALYMTIGSLGYVVNDAFIRRITENGPGVYQVLFFRSLGLVFVFGLAGLARRERLAKHHVSRPMLVRVGAEMIASSLFFAAVIRLEFANAQAILQVVPFAVMLTAAIVLKERVATAQYVAILLGFVGVIIVVRPATNGFSGWSLIVLLSAGFMVVREFATRRIDHGTPVFSIAILTAVGMSLATGLLSLTESWRGFSGESVWFLAAAIGSLTLGYFFTIETVRVGDLSVSAPFRYSILVGAVIAGYLMFDEVPDSLTIIGSSIIVATGIYAVHLERTRRPVTNSG